MKLYLAKNDIIRKLERDIVEAKGVLNCRGLLEQMLKDVYIHNCYGGALNVIGKISQGNGSIEEFLRQNPCF